MPTLGSCRVNTKDFAQAQAAGSGESGSLPVTLKGKRFKDIWSLFGGGRKLRVAEFPVGMIEQWRHQWCQGSGALFHGTAGLLCIVEDQENQGNQACQYDGGRQCIEDGLRRDPAYGHMSNLQTRYSGFLQVITTAEIMVHDVSLTREFTPFAQDMQRKDH